MFLVCGTLTWIHQPQLAIVYKYQAGVSDDIPLSRDASSVVTKAT